MADGKRSPVAVRIMYGSLFIIAILFSLLFLNQQDSGYVLTGINPIYTVVASFALISVCCGYPMFMGRSNSNIKNTMGFSIVISAICMLLCTPILYHFRVGFPIYLLYGAALSFTCITGYIPMAGKTTIISVVLNTLICALPRLWFDLVLLQLGADPDVIAARGGKSFALDSKYYDPGSILWIHIYGGLFGLMADLVIVKAKKTKVKEANFSLKPFLNTGLNYYGASSSLFGLLIFWSAYPATCTYQSDTIDDAGGTNLVGSQMFNLSTHILYTAMCATILVVFPLCAIVDNGTLHVRKVGISVMAGAYAATTMSLPLTQYSAKVINGYLPHPVATVICAMVAGAASVVFMKYAEKPASKRAGHIGMASSFSAHIMPALIGFLFRVIYLAVAGHMDAARGYSSLFGVTVVLGLVMGTFSGAVSIFLEKVAPKKWLLDSNSWESVEVSKDTK